MAKIEKQPSILRSEILLAILEMKDGKAVGVDEILQKC